jgi:uncharacterized protein YbcC (UPF0753/DUF2309 family)
MYHQPLLLSVSFQAPLTRVSNILSKNENLKMLLDNEWIYLLVIDPKQNNDIFRYRKSLQWESVSMNATSTGILKNKKTKLTSSELAV